MVSADSESGAKKKVLVVDDDTDYTEACSLILEKAGFEVAVVHSGEECHKVVGDVAPDVILLDMMMETWSEGSNVVKHLRESEDTKHIPIVIVTNKDQETDRVWGMRQGARAYLTKPFNEQVLLDTILAVM